MSEGSAEIRLSSPDGLAVRLLTHDTSWVGCRVPLRDVSYRELLLGFDSLEENRANQVYASEFLPEGTASGYPRFSGIALELGWLADGPRHSE